MLCCHCWQSQSVSAAIKLNSFYEKLVSDKFKSTAEIFKELVPKIVAIAFAELYAFFSENFQIFTVFCCNSYRLEWSAETRKNIQTWHKNALTRCCAAALFKKKNVNFVSYCHLQFMHKDALDYLNSVSARQRQQWRSLEQRQHSCCCMNRLFSETMLSDVAYFMAL